MNQSDRYTVSDVPSQPTDKWRSNFLSAYLFSKDPATVTRQFLVTGIVWAVLGVALISLLRILLAYPNTDLGWFQSVLGKWLTPTGVVDPRLFQSLVTVHSFIIIYLVLNAAISGGFVNFLLPRLSGDRSLYFPQMLRASFWLFFSGSFFLFLALFAGGPLPVGGWVLHPFLGEIMHDPQADYTYYFLGTGLCLSGALTGSLNRLVTIQRSWNNGNVDIKQPVFWSFLVADALGVLLFMVQLLVLVSLVFYDVFGVSLLYSGMETALPEGGLVQTFSQHLSWLMGHPELYLLLLPAWGMLTAIISNEAGNQLRNPAILRYMFTTIGGLSFVIWLFQQFTPRTGPAGFLIFSTFMLLIALAVLIMVIQWLMLIRRGNLRLYPATLFAIGAMAALGMGGFLGLWTGLFGVGYTGGSYIDVAHFHIGMGVAGVFALFAVVYYWYPVVFGRYMNATMGKVHFWGTLITAFGAVVPMVYLGAAGVFRNMMVWSEFRLFDGIIELQQWVTIFAILGGLVQLVFVVNFFRSAGYGVVLKNGAPGHPETGDAKRITIPPSDQPLPNWVSAYTAASLTGYEKEAE